MFSHYVNSKGADCLNLLQVSSSASKKGRPKDTEVLSDVSDYDSKSDDSDSSTKSDHDDKVTSKRKTKPARRKTKVRHLLFL